MSEVDTAKLYVQFFRPQTISTMCSVKKVLIYMNKILSGHL